MVHSLTFQDFKEVANSNEAGVVQHIINTGKGWVANGSITRVIQAYNRNFLRNFDAKFNEGMKARKGNKVIGKNDGINIGIGLH